MKNIKTIVTLLIALSLCLSCLGCRESGISEPENVILFTDGFPEITPEAPTEYKDRLPNDLKMWRSQLTEEGKQLYDLLLPYFLTLTGFEVNLYKMSESQYSMLELVFHAIVHDYPELQLLAPVYYPYNQEKTGVDLSTFPISNQFYRYKFVFTLNFIIPNGSFTITRSEFEDYIQFVNTACEKFLANMPNNMDKKEKYKWIADELCSITEYSYQDLDASAPLVYGKGADIAYATAYQWLCQVAQLPCTTCSTDDHIWNVVLLEDGRSYYLDATWADTPDGPDEDYYFFTYDQCEKMYGKNPSPAEWAATGNTRKRYW